MNNINTSEQFENFISQLKETNQTLDFICDFDKISQNKLQEAYKIIPRVYNYYSAWNILT